MPPSPRVDAISKTRAIVLCVILIGGIPLIVAGDWVIRKYFHAAPVRKEGQEIRKDK